MNEEAIKKSLAKIESWMKMTCEGCSMPEVINPIINEIKKQLSTDK